MVVCEALSRGLAVIVTAGVGSRFSAVLVPVLVVVRERGCRRGYGRLHQVQQQCTAAVPVTEFVK